MIRYLNIRLEYTKVSYDPFNDGCCVSILLGEALKQLAAEAMIIVMNGISFYFEYHLS